MSKPGVGFKLTPGAQAVWETNSRPRLVFAIDLSARPWGPDGTGFIDRSAYLRRYAGGSDPGRDGYWPQGMIGELTNANREALANWFLAQPEAHRAQWNGAPTEEEQSDLALTTPRRGDFYGEWWWRPKLGGSAGNPIVVTEQNYSTYRRTLDAEGVRTLGLTTIQTTWPWPLFFDVQWLPGAEVEEPPPPPPPPPEDDEEPPPEDEPVPETPPLSPVDVRVEELWVETRQIFRDAAPVPPWLVRLRNHGEPLWRLLLRHAVRIKRKLLEDPEP